VTVTVIGTWDGVDTVLTYGDVNLVFWLVDQQDEPTVACDWGGDQFWGSPPERIRNAIWQREEVYCEAFYLSPQYWASCRSAERDPAWRRRPR
jgi:hypothetical protein